MNNRTSQIESMIQKTYEETFSLIQGMKGCHFIQNENSTYLKTKYSAAFMNGVLYFDDSLPNIKQRILEIHSDLKENGKPYIWRFHPTQQRIDEIESLLVELGLKEIDTHTSVYSEISPSMFQMYEFKSKLEFIPLTIQCFDDWYKVFSDAFEITGDIAEFFKEYEKRNASNTISNYKSYIGYFKNEPVSIVSTVTTDSPLGALFNIGSLKSERGKSYGMQAALHGAEKLFQANKSMVGQFGSKLGVESYTKLGAKLGNEHKQYIWNC